MTADTVVVAADSRMSHGAAGCRHNATIPVILRYDPADPHAVEVVFIAGGEEITWTLARDLLADGLTRPAGLGDVQVWPGPGRHITLALTSDSGQAEFRLPRRAVRRFLARTYAAVPRGAEQPDVDGAIRRLLGGTR